MLLESVTNKGEPRSLYVRQREGQIYAQQEKCQPRESHAATEGIPAPGASCTRRQEKAQFLRNMTEVSPDREATFPSEVTQSCQASDAPKC